ncbi:hypothetical protein E1B28_010747 [Marasmius oreades]|uniref:Uncharacterized protein n=1 Tax=Marasmius oreades TaxID=181124 RepID=A0A9P7RSV9_9AGAR|nr:uncharacterized protein E1B28_010747 [Marasmius oreades]KAG7089037.1 hypothetical protein E1B28_010747 [Marasmius oreades]
MALPPATSINYIPSVVVTAPLYSGADLCEMARRLNYQIRQAAASITDTSFEFPGEKARRPRDNEARQFIKSKMINRIYNVQKKGLGEGLLRVLLQKGLEGVMVVACSKMLATWSKDKVESEVLSNFYKSRMQQSGYWRSMTKKAAKLSFHKGVKEELLDCLNQVVNQIIDVSGRGSFELDVAIQDGIGDVCDAVMRLDKALSEDPTDDDWEVFYAFPDSEIDIETTEPNGEISGLVICPTDLGLRRAIFTNATSDIPSGSTMVEFTISHWQTILKAKALLEGDCI